MIKSRLSSPWMKKICVLLLLIAVVVGGIFFIYLQRNEKVSRVVNVTNADIYLNMPTSYDGQGQVVHPDIVYIPCVWNGYKYWMALTPYPYSDNSYENPSILASNDGYHWVVPSGLVNPIISSPNPGYNADPDIVYNADTSELWVYFFRYWSDTNLVKLTLMRSSTGVTWSGPQYLITWNLTQEDNGRSYAVIKQNQSWLMYYERGQGDDTWLEMRKSNNGINWSKPQKVNITIQNRNIWHLDVYPYERYYIMLIAAYPKGLSSRHCDLFYAYSEDKVNWDVTSNPILKNSDSGWDNANIYRSTFIINNATFKVWYSAMNTNKEWYIGYTEDSNWSYKMGDEYKSAQK